MTTKTRYRCIAPYCEATYATWRGLTAHYDRHPEHAEEAPADESLREPAEQPPAPPPTPIEPVDLGTFVYCPNCDVGIHKHIYEEHAAACGVYVRL